MLARPSFKGPRFFDSPLFRFYHWNFNYDLLISKHFLSDYSYHWDWNSKSIAPASNRNCHHIHETFLLRVFCFSWNSITHSSELSAFPPRTHVPGTDSNRWTAGCSRPRACSSPPKLRNVASYPTLVSCNPRWLPVCSSPIPIYTRIIMF